MFRYRALTLPGGPAILGDNLLVLRYHALALEDKVDVQWRIALRGRWFNGVMRRDKVSHIQHT